MRVENEILQNLPSGSFFQEHVPLSLRKIFTDRFTAFGHQGASRGQPIPADYTTSENGYTSKNENGEELRERSPHVSKIVSWMIRYLNSVVRTVEGIQ